MARFHHIRPADDVEPNPDLHQILWNYLLTVKAQMDGEPTETTNESQRLLAEVLAA